MEEYDQKDGVICSFVVYSERVQSLPCRIVLGARRRYCFGIGDDVSLTAEGLELTRVGSVSGHMLSPGSIPGAKLTVVRVPRCLWRCAQDRRAGLIPAP